jgi:hypothetical protein
MSIHGATVACYLGGKSTHLVFRDCGELEGKGKFSSFAILAKRQFAWKGSGFMAFGNKSSRTILASYLPLEGQQTMVETRLEYIKKISLTRSSFNN